MRRTDWHALQLVLLAVAIPFILVSLTPLRGDIWWILRTGDVMVAQQHLLDHDPFTFAPHTSGFVQAQWLADLAYFGAFKVMDLEGVVFFNALVGALTFGLVVWLAWRRSKHVTSSCLITLGAAALALSNFNPRAQTLAFPLFLGTFVLLESASVRRRNILGLAGLQVVWANLHGSFFLGPLLTCMYLAGTAVELFRRGGLAAVTESARVRWLSFALGAQAVATFATPNGWSLYDYAVSVTSDPIIRTMNPEWSPPVITDPLGLPMFLSIGLAILVVARSDRRATLTDVLVLVAFGLLGLQAVRNMVWWALVFAPVLAPYLARLRYPGPLERRLRRRGDARRTWPALARTAVLAAVVIACLPWVKPLNPLVPAQKRALISTDYPLAAMTFLQTHALPQRLFTDQTWDGYVDWLLWPRYEPMVDEAMNVHPPEVWTDVLAINIGHVSWQDRLDHNHVEVLLLNRAYQSALIDAVERSSAWQPVYTDSQAIIFTRANLTATERPI